jgi:hypothetical protein
MLFDFLLAVLTDHEDGEVRSSETSVNFYRTTRSNIPEDYFRAKASFCSVIYK